MNARTVILAFINLLFVCPNGTQLQRTSPAIVVFMWRHLMGVNQIMNSKIPSGCTHRAIALQTDIVQVPSGCIHRAIALQTDIGQVPS